VTMMSRRQAGLIPRHPHEGRCRRSSVSVHPAHAARCTARHGVVAIPNPARREHLDCSCAQCFNIAQRSGAVPCPSREVGRAANWL
jgi:hypothetical protein